MRVSIHVLLRCNPKYFLGNDSDLINIYLKSITELNKLCIEIRKKRVRFIIRH